jgi:protein-L-isoaspartate O-methyltransferase
MTPTETWQAHARALADEITPTGSRWRDAVQAVPRHLFVPKWWTWDADSWTPHDGQADPETWMRAAYSNRTLITRVGSTHADQANESDHPIGMATSSATLPGLVVQMFRHTRPHEGMNVLDVGTGSGYSAALLAHRFGSARVTSIDIDPYLISAAAGRLDAAGLKPELVACDAAGELPSGAYDRIVSMVSVPRVPASWLAALRTGGRLVTTIAGTWLIIGAEKTADGGAIGRVEPDWASFMATRHGPDYPPRLMTQHPHARDADGQHINTGRYPVMNVANSVMVRSMLALAVPGVQTHYEETDDGRRTGWLLHDNGSWARAEAEGTEPPTVHESGPTPLWHHLERIQHRLASDGDLPIPGCRVEIEPNGACHLTRDTRHGPFIHTIA